MGGGENAAGEAEQHLLSLSKAFCQVPRSVSPSASERETFGDRVQSPRGAWGVGGRGGVEIGREGGDGAGGKTAPRIQAPPRPQVYVYMSNNRQGGATQRGSPAPHPTPLLYPPTPPAEETACRRRRQTRRAEQRGD